MLGSGSSPFVPLHSQPPSSVPVALPSEVQRHSVQTSRRRRRRVPLSACGLACRMLSRPVHLDAFPLFGRLSVSWYRTGVAGWVSCQRLGFLGTVFVPAAGRHPIDGFFELKGLALMLLRKKGSAEAAPATPSAVFAAEDIARWQNVLDFLSVSRYPDGSARTVGSLVLFCEDNRVKCCVCDKDNGLVAFQTADGVAALLEHLNVALEADSLDWKADSRGKSKKR